MFDTLTHWMISTQVMIMGNGKWNDIHQGWTGPAVYRFAGKPQWYWEESAERLRNHANLKPGTSFVPAWKSNSEGAEPIGAARRLYGVAMLRHRRDVVPAT